MKLCSVFLESLTSSCHMGWWSTCPYYYVPCVCNGWLLYFPEGSALFTGHLWNLFPFLVAFLWAPVYLYLFFILVRPGLREYFRKWISSGLCTANNLHPIIFQFILTYCVRSFVPGFKELFLTRETAHLSFSPTQVAGGTRKNWYRAAFFLPWRTLNLVK